jgi:hypothetical protein
MKSDERNKGQLQKRLFQKNADAMKTVATFILWILGSGTDCIIDVRVTGR